MTGTMLVTSGLYLAKGAAVTLGLSLATIAVAAALGLPLARPPLRMDAAAPARRRLWPGRARRAAPRAAGRQLFQPALSRDRFAALTGRRFWSAGFISRPMRPRCSGPRSPPCPGSNGMPGARSACAGSSSSPSSSAAGAPLGIAPFVNVALVVVKNTSLVSAIGGWELVAAGREIGERSMEILPAYLAVAAFYFVICFTLSRIGRHLEQRHNHG